MKKIASVLAFILFAFYFLRMAVVF